MGDQLSGKRVAILATDGVERVELEQPRAAVADAGAEVELVSIHDGEIQARNHDLDDAGTFTVDRVITDASVDDYDALLLPGGTVNPDQLRTNSDAVSFVRDFLHTASRSARSATAPGRCWRRAWSRADGSRVGRACAPTCAMPAPKYSTRRS